MATKRAKSLTKPKRGTKRGTKGKSKAKPARARAKAKTSVEKFKSTILTSTVPDSLDFLINSSARALGLPLKPAWRQAVKGNLDVTLRLAALFTDFPLPDDAEPAPVFVA